METSSSAPDQTSLADLRRRRAELRDSLSALEQALAAPAPRGLVPWTLRVHVALVELSADFREHIGFTEGPDGLYVDVLATAPRLSGAVDLLIREHAQTSDLLEDLLSRSATPESLDVDQLRRIGTALLGLLVSHRQRGSDLLYEAFAFDVGGEE